MNIGQILGFASVVGITISGVFFYVARELPILRRIAASLHGILAVVFVPMIGLLQHQIQESSIRAGITIIFCMLSFLSILYSMSVLKVRWSIHLLHIATLGILWGNLVLGMMMAYGT